MVKGTPINKPKYSNYAIYKKHTNRSLKAYLTDKAKTGKVVKSYNYWLSDPRRYDYEGIDTPENIFYYVKKGKKKTRHYTTKYRRTYWKRKKTIKTERFKYMVSI